MDIYFRKFLINKYYNNKYRVKLNTQRVFKNKENISII